MTTKLSELIDFVKKSNKQVIADANFLQLNDECKLCYPFDGKPVYADVSTTALEGLCKLNGISWSYFRKIPNELKQLNLNWFLDRSKASYMLNFVDDVIAEVHDTDASRTVLSVLDAVKTVFDDEDEDPYVIQASMDAKYIAFYLYWGKDKEYSWGVGCKGIMIFAPMQKGVNICASPVLCFPSTETVIEFSLSSQCKKAFGKNKQVDDCDMIQYAIDNMDYIDKVLNIGLEEKLESVEHFFSHDAVMHNVKGKLGKITYDNCQTAKTCIELVQGILNTQEQVTAAVDVMRLGNLAGYALHPYTPIMCSHCHSVISESEQDID